jgi:hypothetical protein
MGDSAKLALWEMLLTLRLSRHFSSSEVVRRPSCRRRSQAPHPSCSWTRRRRGTAHIRDVLCLASPAQRHPALGHLVGVNRRVAPGGRWDLRPNRRVDHPGMDCVDPDPIAGRRTLHRERLGEQASASCGAIAGKLCGPSEAGYHGAAVCKYCVPSCCRVAGRGRSRARGAIRRARSGRR